MSSSNVLTTEQIKASEAWIRAFYEAKDPSTNDPERWLTEFCQPDVILNYGNITLKGYKEISAISKEDFKRQAVKRIIKHIDVLPDRIYVRVDAIFILKNDPEQKEITIK